MEVVRMKVSLVAIGNSKGIRIPRSVIKECGFGDHVEMRVGKGNIVLTPVRAIREGWDAAFAGMAVASDDAPLLPGNLSPDWDGEEWEW